MISQRNYYRPQRSCGQGYVFTRVCDSVHRGGSASVHAGIPSPLGGRHPPGKQTPPREADTPREVDTPREADTPPWEADTPREAYSGIRSMSGRYASYWNAFLLQKCIQWVSTTFIESNKTAAYL